MNKSHRKIIVSFAVVSPFVISALSAVGQKPTAALNPQQLAFFESKVRPVLLSSCVSCHNKDNAQGGLKLDAAISKEKAAEVVARIKALDGKPRMPQGGKLSDDKIAAIEDWVKTGAGWPTAVPVIAGPTLFERGKKHWSFQPLKSIAVPKVKQSTWVQNPIDAFVLQKLEAKGMHPNVSASKRELIRRVTYDLLGLPPTPEEVAAFEANRSPDAYEKLVERLLASPHYGEKWGRFWLDLVRFAETNSYERDNPKPYVYKYRDYVIRAFNNDKPYDRFVKEQLAGDEMSDNTGDAALATGYYRLGIWDDEPADRLQASMDDLDDIIATTSQTFLGLTVDCARCHDHKLDPITQKDYYKLQAVFFNVNRFKNGGPTDETQYFPSMASKVDYEKRMADLKTRRDSFEKEVAAIVSKIQSKGAAYYNPADISGTSYTYYERDWKRIPDFENEPAIASGKSDTGLISLKPRLRNEEFSLSYNGQIDVPVDGDYTFHFKSEGGYRFSVEGQLFEQYASQDKAIEHVEKRHLKKGKKGWSLTYNQRQHQHGFAISWSGPGFERRPLSDVASCGLDCLPTLFGSNLDKVIGKEDADKLAKLINEQAAIEKLAPPTDKALCVTEAGATPKETHLLLRGVPTALGDVVQPGLITIAGGPDVIKGTPPANNKSTGLRTIMANWIASPSNPLTARVMVNRIWQGHFGRGITRTGSDFGLMGLAPTHPELLDWLANDFVKQGWSIKKLHRLIMNSNTYKQSSKSNPEFLAKDPQNDLFWRSEMRRLTAEEIRDSMLSVCGNLNLELFGPSVYPEISKEILAAQSRPGKDWFMERMSAEDVCRRSIYINVKRSLVYPILASFDLPETDRPSAIRFASTQPTQALALMNGTLFAKQAQILSERVQKEASAEPGAFSKRLISLVTQRAAKPTEITEGVSLYKRLIAKGAKPEQALKYLCLMALNLNEFVYVD